MIWLYTLAFAQEPSPQETIQKAFEREYAYVYAEKQSLDKQLEELRKHKVSSLSESESNLVSIERELAFEKQEYERLALELEALEKETSRRADMESAFHNMLIQAEQSLGEESKEASPQERFAELFTTLRSKIHHGRSVKREQGSIFLEDGSKVSGEILQVGEIAAFGRVGQQTASLLSLGNNAFRLDTSMGGAVGTAPI